MVEREKESAPQEVVTLATLKDGAAAELFQAELEKVLRNIEDRNTDWKAKRKITLEVIFQTSEDRDVGDVTIRATSKIAGLKPAQTIVYYGRHRGQPVAVENNPKQSSLFSQPAAVVDAATLKGGK